MIKVKDKKCHVIVIQSYDPFLNLAIEQFYLNQVKENEYYFLLWRSQPCMVLGRFQNPWTELNTKLITKETIPIVRRISGGGCVYHDLGNLNYCFISNEENWQRREHCEFILDSLSDFNITGHVTEKFDIHLNTTKGDCKVSGSAFKQSRNKKLHHGTLLVSARLNSLKQYLKVPVKSIESKAIASRPKSVVNLIDLNSSLDISKIQNNLIRKFMELTNGLDSVMYVGFEMLNNPAVLVNYHKLKDVTWILGETPKFTQSIEYNLSWSCGRVLITCVKAKIAMIEIEDGYFHPDVNEYLNKLIANQDFTANGIQTLFLETAKKFTTYNEELLNLSKCIVGGIA